MSIERFKFKNLNFTANFTFNTKEHYISTLLSAILHYLFKMSLMDKEQAVFEQLTK